MAKKAHGCEVWEEKKRPCLKKEHFGNFNGGTLSPGAGLRGKKAVKRSNLGKGGQRSIRRGGWQGWGWLG